MQAQEISRITIKLINSLVNTAVLIIVILLAAFAGYALWDSEQIYAAADKSNYAVYKPTAANEGKSFKELQAINPEVFAWLNVYGTNIDYPVTQGPDNMKYVNTNAEGLYSLAGALFLDCNSSKDFSDFNNILFGHHMEKKAMFGEIGNFSARDMFDTRKYGNLYFDEQDHGIEFFAFIHTDAYNNTVFKANVKAEERQAYLDGLLSIAMHQRALGITIEDHLVLLSTCSASSTNGRDILVGRITDKLYEDTFAKAETTGEKDRMSVDSHVDYLKEILRWLPIPAIALLLALHIRQKRKLAICEQKRGVENE